VRPIRLQLSVRVLMLLVLLLGGAMGWWTYLAHVQRDAVAEIVRRRGKVYYDWEVMFVPRGGFYQPNPGGRPWWPRWIVTRLGPDYFSDVKVVMLGPDDADVAMASVGLLSGLGGLHSNRRGTKLTEAGLANLRGLTHLRQLSLSSSKEVTGAWLAIVKDLRQLQRLEFNNARVFVDADLAPLAALTDIRTLMLRGPGISDAGLVHLRGMAKMHSLTLIDNHVTSAGLEHLRSMALLESLDLNRSRVESLAPIRQVARLRKLWIASTPIADAALTDLKGLDQLDFLDLSGTEVTDAGLEHLRGLKKLRTLRVRGTKVTPEAFTALQKDLPLLVPESPPNPASSRRPGPSPKAKVVADPAIGVSGQTGERKEGRSPWGSPLCAG
jgi:hypothetical protein